jgi:hypothetical protein
MVWGGFRAIIGPCQFITMQFQASVVSGEGGRLEACEEAGDRNADAEGLFP